MPIKVLDYGKSYPFGETIGKPRNLAWPVNAYRVTLPKPDDDDRINIFERVILKIIDACDIRETEELAREVCIPSELVKCILLRMKDKGLIDENNEICKQSRHIWTKEKEPVYITALAFRELATGKILPFLHLLDNENPLEKEEKEEKNFRVIRWEPGHKNRKPEIMDIMRALRTMEKRSGAFRKYRRFPAVDQILIEGEPELYYLDCPIAIQKNDGDFRIADPFIDGFSMIFESSFSYLREQDDNLDNWYMNWNKELINQEPNKPAETEKEPFETNANWGYYRNLIYNMRRRENAEFRSIEQIHASLEWALFYSCIQYQYRDAVTELELTEQAEHPKLLKDAAKKIGLRLEAPDKTGGSRHIDLLPVLEGRLEDFLDGDADLATVMSIALLIAAKDPSHPLRRIARRQPDLIIQLLDIKRKRDEQGHGRSAAQIYDNELPEEHFMRKIITALLPEIRFSDTPAAAVDMEFKADNMHNARTNIQMEFGFKNCNLLGPDLQEKLVYAERLFLLSNNENKKDDVDAKDFIFSLYAVIQAIFRKILADTLPPDIDDSDFIITAQKKANETGFRELPGSLTIKSLKIRQTLQGKDQTLGACAIAFLLVSDEDTLKIISQNQPLFFSVIADISDARGHGNVPVPMKKDEFKEFRKEAYKIIKILLEV